jgi:hypothetical protein
VKRGEKEVTRTYILEMLKKKRKYGEKILGSNWLKINK